jgi:hypothetical protein
MWTQRYAQDLSWDLRNFIYDVERKRESRCIISVIFLRRISMRREEGWVGGYSESVGGSGGVINLSVQTAGHDTDHIFTWKLWNVSL